MGRMDRFSYGNDPLGDPLGPSKDKMDPFCDPKDRLGEEIDFFRKKRIISKRKGSIMKEKNQMAWRRIAIRPQMGSYQEYCFKKFPKPLERQYLELTTQNRHTFFEKM